MAARSYDSDLASALRKDAETIVEASGDSMERDLERAKEAMRLAAELDEGRGTPEIRDEALDHLHRANRRTFEEEHPVRPEDEESGA